MSGTAAGNGRNNRFFGWQTSGVTLEPAVWSAGLGHLPRSGLKAIFSESPQTTSDVDAAYNLLVGEVSFEASPFNTHLDRC